MLKTYAALRQRAAAMSSRATAEDGTTVPEYMLVLGFISLIIVVAFQTSGVGNAITAMSTELANKIN